MDRYNRYWKLMVWLALLALALGLFFLALGGWAVYGGVVLIVLLAIFVAVSLPALVVTDLVMQRRPGLVRMPVRAGVAFGVAIAATTLLFAAFVLSGFLSDPADPPPTILVLGALVWLTVLRTLPPTPAARPPDPGETEITSAGA